MKFITLILLLCQLPVFSQTPNTVIKPKQVIAMNGLNGSHNAFIKNIGQYGDSIAEHAKMGIIKYGYEGNDMLVLFTPKGLIHLHRKIKRPSEKEEKELERKGIPEQEIEKRVTVTEKVITMEWLGANPNPEIIAEEKTADYHTYGLLQDKAYGYRKIIYKNLYPGIDVIYHFTTTNKTGFEYSIVLHPGANPELIKMKYGGDIKNIKVDKAGNLVINSDINGVIETAATAFSNTGAVVKLFVDKENPQQLYNVSYKLKNKLVSFSVPVYNKTKTLVIDPFVNNTNTLTGADNAGKAIDIDFDYAGNIYVAGGGSSNACKLAKFDASGTLLWTFSGTLTTPTFTWFGYGGWVVEKSSGNIFIGQGATLFGGTKIIRLSSSGVYDNFITDPNPNFLENWKMLWNCNSGNPQILVAGGGNNSNINLGVCEPPRVTISGINITGIIPTFYQDIADIVIDPLTNDMYTIFASPDNTTVPINSTPGINNHIFKHSSPYSASTIAWEVATGYNTLIEIANRPYLAPGSGFASNSLNALAINSSYLYYWDGLYLKAFNKTDGSTAGLPLTLTGNAVKMQGGVIADECNNVFIGNVNGTIKVYKFDGVSFNDAAAPDIGIPGFQVGSVYDLVYDDARKLLYASGDGFVASIDIASYCTASGFNLTVTVDCTTPSVQANINPAPPVGTTLTYTLVAGNTQIATNATGFFTGVVPGINYTIKAFLNQACSGTQLIQNFSLIGCPVPEISVTFINPSCNLSNGSINAVAINGTPAYQFSKDGITFQSSGIFTGLSAGNYSIIVKDAVNFSDTIKIILVNSLPLQVTATPVASSCTQNTGIITATGSGGAAPLKYSIDGIAFGPSGIFTGLATGGYTITVKDTNACIAAIPVYIDSLNTVTANAGDNITICQGGKQTLAAVSNGNSFLWTPSTGLSNPNLLTPDASPATATIYTLTATTGICKATSSLTVFISPAAKLFVGNDTIIAINQPLPLQGIDVNNTGFINYTWSPAYGLNNPFVKGPVAILDKDILYTVVAQNAYGCTGTDDIKIKVYKGPDIYVPNAFTPGVDGLNDVLRPIVVGMKEFHYFRVFNKYGQLVFTTANAANGWDGNFKAAQQPIGTYIWMAEAVDYRGNIIQRKGSVILIR